MYNVKGVYYDKVISLFPLLRIGNPGNGVPGFYFVERVMDLPKIIEYEHHGAVVKVREDLKGKHKDYCLCHRCKLFNPGSPMNCPRAINLFALCVKQDMVTPVWECPNFEPKDNN